jgi:hypothetical protein
MLPILPQGTLGGVGGHHELGGGEESVPSPISPQSALGGVVWEGGGGDETGVDRFCLQLHDRVL